MRTHGIYATYADGCRCEQCRRASADYQLRRRARGRKLTALCPLCDRWFVSNVGRGVHEVKAHA